MAFVNVEGTITRVFYEGKGAELTETFTKRDGSEGKKRFTLWFKEAHGLNDGATGKFSGMLGADVDEWQDKEGNTRHTVKLSVNGARVQGHGASQSAPAAVADEPWAPAAPAAANGSQGGFAQGVSSDELPF